jgi:DNA-binding Lrp family transcriptional regulator
VSEAELLEILRRFDREGVMRRYAAVLRHRRAGFRGNGMGCWVVPEERIVAAGKAAAAFRPVSHCYQRPAFPPRWPYNLFTMVHGQERAEVEAIVERIREEIEPEAYTVLYSVREFKKERVRYFEQG